MEHDTLLTVYYPNKLTAESFNNSGGRGERFGHFVNPRRVSGGLLFAGH